MTLDAIFAVLVASTLIVYSYLYLSRIQGTSYNEQHLYKMTMDSLAILEKDETMLRAVEKMDVAELQTFVNNMPFQICGYIAVYTGNSTGLFSVIKDDCPLSAEYVSSRRVFVVDQEIFYAHMRSWYKENE